MIIGRRPFLKLLGGVGLAAGGYLGVNEMTSGRWLYDPEELTAARNKFFGIVDYQTMYEIQQQYGEESDEETGVAGTGDIKPSDIHHLAGVGACSISGHNGVPSGVLSMAVTGEFDADAINDPADESQMLEEQDPDGPGGYTYWKADIPSDSTTAGSGASGSETDSTDEPDFAPENLAMGVKKGQFVTGAVHAPEAKETTSMDAVTKMIAAKKRGGGVSGPDLLTADDEYDSIRSQFGPNPTFLFGAIVDPALVALSVAMSEIILGFAGGFARPAGGFADAVTVFLEQWVEDLRAAPSAGPSTPKKRRRR